MSPLGNHKAQQGGLGFLRQQILVAADHVGVKFAKTLGANLSRITDVSISCLWLLLLHSLRR